MARLCTLFVGSLLALLVGAAPSPAEAQGFKWWQSEKFQKEMALSPDQISRLDAVFQSALPALRAQKRALDKLEDELSQMVADARVGEPELEAFAARVESSRAELSKTRTLQLYRMRRVLTAEQHQKMKALHEQWERDRPRGRQPQ